MLSKEWLGEADGQDPVTATMLSHGLAACFLAPQVKGFDMKDVQVCVCVGGLRW